MADKNIIDVREIAKKFLIDNGYDGLCKKSQETLNERLGLFEYEDQCSCGIDDLICCTDSCPEECFPGYKVPLMTEMTSHDGRLNEFDWYISTEHR